MEKFKVIIIGTGFGGQSTAIRLNKMGIRDYIMLERREFMGGTWAQNTYPGAAVDVHSPLYSLSNEPYRWSQMFAQQEELKQYTNYIIDKHKLREKARINTNVNGVHWDEGLHRWIVDTNSGQYSAQFLVNSSGPLSTPAIPNFKGKDRFKGKSFHTNHWDHSFDYKDKRVAIIGSGASAAQVIPAIVGDVKELHVFQRTPHWVMPRPDRKFNEAERYLLGFEPVYNFTRNMIYWQLESRILGFKYSKEFLNTFAQRQAEQHLKKQVSDPQLRAKLTPDFTIGCKRVILSNTLLPALTRDNVTLHTKHQGISEIIETGIITTDEEALELDLIIYATGYDATDGVISYPVVGKNGKSLKDAWQEFPRAYLGTTIPGFPNLFVVTGPNTGIGHTSALVIIESQMEYIERCIKAVNAQGIQAIEVRQEAEEKYTTNIHSEMEKTVWKTGGCNSWYQSKSGHIVSVYPGFTFTYRNKAMNFKPQHHQFS